MLPQLARDCRGAPPGEGLASIRDVWADKCAPCPKTQAGAQVCNGGATAC